MQNGKMRFVIHKQSSPKWEHVAEAGTVDEVLRYLREVHRAKRFTVDFDPWEGFLTDDCGAILRDEYGIGLRKHTGSVLVTICD